jgi:hypothetical protein
MYQQNFYSVPWQRIGELLPVSITEKELIIYGPEVREIARHDLYPSGITREKHTLAEHCGAYSCTRSPEGPLDSRSPMAPRFVIGGRGGRYFSCGKVVLTG